MYICTECGEVFEEPVMIKDDPSPAGVSLTSGYYVYESCPHCSSDRIEEAEQCKCCGEWYDHNKGSDVLCDDCYDTVEMKLEKIRQDHGLTKDDFEQVIAEIFGW